MAFFLMSRMIPLSEVEREAFREHRSWSARLSAERQ
jgi:hypothetical protein